MPLTYGELDYGAETYGGPLAVETPIRARRVRVREPSWIGVTIEAPGEDVRCSPLENSAFGIPTQLEFATETPGYFGAASFTLPRPDWFAADEIRRWLYAPVRFFDEDNRTVYEGRVTGNSQAGAAEITIECEGWAKSLEDREDARQIFVDRDLGKWQAVSATRRAALLATPFTVFDHSVDPDDTGQSQILTEVQDDWPSNADSEALYDAGPGQKVASVYADWISYGVTPYAFFVQDVVACDNDTVVGYVDWSGDLQPSATGAAYYSGAAKRCAMLQLYHPASGGTQGQRYGVRWRKVAVYGNHGLTRRGTAPGGFYLSDIAPYIVGRWGTLLNLTSRSIEQTSFVIPHSVFTEPTKPLDMIESLVLFGGNSLLPMDWGVSEGREFFMASPGNYGKVWRTRLDEGAESTSAGDDAKTRVNGVLMTWQDGAGHSHTVGPPGSGADTETTALLDISPDNPVNYGKGVKDRIRSASMETTSENGAILAAQLILAEANRQRWSGDIDLKGHQREYGGSEQPPYLVRAGDRGVVEDEPDTAERRVTATTYDTERRSVKATIGQPPSRFETLLARAGVVLEGRL